jgi:tetratricopeptide (TPR) repeat protein
MNTLRRRRIVVDDSALAQSIGTRIRAHRRRAGLSQQRLAEGRYTKAYISALETGAAKPSMAALNFIAGRLGTTAAELLANPETAWTRLEADLMLASGDPRGAADAYVDLIGNQPDPTLRAELLRSLAEASCRIDRPVEAIRAGSEAVELFGALGRRSDRALASFWLASAQNLQDNSDDARRLFAELLTELRAGLVVAPDFELRVLVALATTESYRGTPMAAVGYLEEARALSVDFDDRRRGIVLLSLANSYRGAGDTEAAIRYGGQALTMLRAAEADLEAAMLENNLALAYLSIGSIDRAAELVTEAQEIGRRHGDDRLLAHLADTEAQVTLASGQPERAIDLAVGAIERAERAGATKAAIDAWATLARARFAAGQVDPALDAFARATELARSGAPAPRLREVLKAWADALAAAGRHAEAYALAREALGGEGPTDRLPVAEGMAVESEHEAHTA